jgi:hypothetical protein
VDELDTRGSAWRQLDEELQIMRWRTERLLALGYRLREAAFLALAEVDIPRARTADRERLPARDGSPDRRLTSLKTASSIRLLTQARLRSR